MQKEKLAKPKVTEEFIRFWLLRFRKLDMRLKDQRQALVDTFINSIYLYDDKVLITFNYQEGTQTVTFGEATEVASEGNGSDLDCIPAVTAKGKLPCKTKKTVDSLPPGRHSYGLGTAAESGGQGLTGCVC